MGKTISHAVNACSLNIKCVFDQVQNQYMKETVKHSIEKLPKLF